MSRTTTTLATLLLFCLLCTQNAAAQAPPHDPVSFNFDGGMLFQSSADLKDTEGDFSVNRWFASIGLNYAWNVRNSIGISFGGGGSKYDLSRERTKGADGWSL